MEAPLRRCRWRLWQRLNRATKAYLSSRPWQRCTGCGLSCWLCLFQRQEEEGISRWRETQRKVFIFTSGGGLFGKKLMVRGSFEQNVCWKCRHCFWMKKFSYFFPPDEPQSSDSIFYWKRFHPQAFWTASKHSVSCFSHSTFSPDESVLFALFVLYFKSTGIANVANENIFRI